jgi:NTE family protein
LTITTDKLLLLKSHECSNGLNDEALQEIANTAELVQVDSGEYLHRANQKLTSVYFIVHGRLKQSIVDMHGNVLLQHFLSRGTQFGALGAAQADPIPVDVVAIEPSAALRIDFDTTRKLSFKYDEFGANITRLIGSMVRRALLADRKPKKKVFHRCYYS